MFHYMEFHYLPIIGRILNLNRYLGNDGCDIYGILLFLPLLEVFLGYVPFSRQHMSTIRGSLVISTIIGNILEYIPI